MNFDKIGSLREDSNGDFFIGPYIDPNATAYPDYRAAAYNELSPGFKGPFTSISDWYNAMTELNRKSALNVLEDEGEKDEILADYEILAEFADVIAIEEFRNGPFVVNHNDLTIQNILVPSSFSLKRYYLFMATY